MLDAAGVREVEHLLRATADREIRPWFGRLTAADVTEKAPGDLVTVADRGAEQALTDKLLALLPASVVVGEEAVAHDPGRLEALDGDAPVWVLDPIDGTHNFVAGSPRFTTLLTLAQRGQLLASWTYAPELDLMAVATAGGGAYVDGRRVRVGKAPDGLKFLDVSTVLPLWWSPRIRTGMNRLCRHGISMCFMDTAGLEYIELASGRRTAMISTWQLPWDHAAGILLLLEAGGVVMTRDGTSFRLAGGNALPFVAAPDAACATALLAGMEPSGTEPRRLEPEHPPAA